VKNSVRYKRRSKRSRAGKRRLAVVVVLVVAALAFWSMLRPHARATAERDVLTRRIAVPPRATPAPARWTPAELSRMRADLGRAFAPALSDRYSLAVIDATGRVIYGADDDRAVAPASVQKLIVADAALRVLGPDYRFHTVLAAEHAPSSDGVLEGNLWLVGSGDPSLRSSDLREGIALLARAGLRRIDGAIAVDAHEMTGPEINPHWNPDDANEDFQAPTSAISIDDDTAEFRVYGGAPGTPARVVVVPANRALHLSGEVMTSAASDSVIIAADAPDVFRLAGTIPADTEEKFWLPVHDMPRYAGDVLMRMAHQAGIAVASPPAVSSAPLDTIVLWDHRSQPLRVLMTHMLFVSDNHYAEELMRTLGVDAGGTGSDADGLAAELHFLRSAGIPAPGLHVVDGSGLAEADRVAAITLARVLSDAELDDRGTPLYGMLPAGGRDGTLKNYDFTSALGRIRAKTGHLSDADSLAGYINTRHHGRLAFAFMINDSPGDPDAAYVRAVDRLSEF
jgi:D-alanyl-D-alanine carboxypeptidase/D-alanyl-D-alanine-endopeptidase (penicillin-binding protein 4)